jgi:hypothetical protein
MTRTNTAEILLPTILAVEPDRAGFRGAPECARDGGGIAALGLSSTANRPSEKQRTRLARPENSMYSNSDQLAAGVDLVSELPEYGIARSRLLGKEMNRFGRVGYGIDDHPIENALR